MESFTDFIENPLDTGTDSAGGNPIAGASTPGKVGEDPIDYFRQRALGQQQNRARIAKLAHSRGLSLRIDANGSLAELDAVEGALEANATDLAPLSAALERPFDGSSLSNNVARPIKDDVSRFHLRIHAAVGRDGFQMSAEAFDGRCADGTEASSCPNTLKKALLIVARKVLNFDQTDAKFLVLGNDIPNRVDLAFDWISDLILSRLPGLAIDTHDPVSRLEAPAHAALFRMVMDLALHGMRLTKPLSFSLAMTRWTLDLDAQPMASRISSKLGA